MTDSLDDELISSLRDPYSMNWSRVYVIRDQTVDGAVNPSQTDDTGVRD
jgi:hypothetical protein